MDEHDLLSSQSAAHHLTCSFFPPPMKLLQLWQMRRLEPLTLSSNHPWDLSLSSARPLFTVSLLRAREKEEEGSGKSWIPSPADEPTGYLQRESVHRLKESRTG